MTNAAISLLCSDNSGEGVGGGGARGPRPTLNIIMYQTKEFVLVFNCFEELHTHMSTRGDCVTAGSNVSAINCMEHDSKG